MITIKNIQSSKYDSKADLLTTNNSQLTETLMVNMTRHAVTVSLILLLFVSDAVAAQFTFTPRASVQGEYTDNLFLLPADEREDYIVTTSVGFTAGVAGNTANATLSYDPAYVWYDEFDENNGWRHIASLLGEWNITQYTRFNLSDNLLHTEDPLSELEIDVLRGEIPPPQGDTTRRIGREPYTRNRALALLTHNFGREDQLYLEYVHNLLNNEDGVFNEDSQSHNGTAGITFWFTNKWGTDWRFAYTRALFDPDNTFIGDPSSDLDRWSGFARLLYRFSRNLDGYFRYDHTYVDFDEEDEFDYNVYNPSIGIDYRIEEDIQFLTSVGYSVREFKDAVIQGIQEELDRGYGLTFTADLIKTQRRVGYRIYVATGYNQEVISNQNLGFTRYYMAGYSVNYELIRHLQVDSYALYRRNEYEDTIPQRDDDVYRFGLGLGYGPTQWMTIRLGYAYNRIDSNRPINDYTENRGSLTFTFTPVQPYRF